MSIRWTRGALRQLRAIEAYLRDRDAGAAARTVGRIERATGRLARMPHLGRPARERDVRLLVVVGTPYVIVYAPRGADLVILALFHERQQRPTPYSSD